MKLPRSATFIPVLLAALVAGPAACGPSPAVIRFRAQQPPFEAAERRVRIALATDGYAIAEPPPGTEESAPAGSVTTGWKDLAESEKGAAERKSVGVAQGKVAVRLAPRGMLYDVECAIATRSVTARDTVVHAPDTHHPLMLKWQRVLTKLLTPEERSED